VLWAQIEVGGEPVEDEPVDQGLDVDQFGAL